MSSTSAIVPCGPGFEARGRRVVGLIGCHHCDQFATVRPDVAGKLSAYCDGLFHPLDKCGATYAWPRGATVTGINGPADLNAYADDVRDMRPEIRAALALSWGITSEQLETFAHGPQHREPLSRNPEEHDPVKPAQAPTGPGTDPGTIGAADPGNPAQIAGKPAPAAGTAEFGAGRSEGTGPGSGTKRHWAGRYLGKR